MKLKLLLLATTMISAAPVLPALAASDSPFVVAQASDQDQRREERQKAREQRQQERQDTREQRQQERRDQRQEERQKAQQERQEERREQRQEERQKAQQQRQEERREQRQDAREQRQEERREQRREERREERREQARDDAAIIRGRGQRFDDLRRERREERQGDRIVIREPGGRAIIRENGRAFITSNDANRFRIIGGNNARFERRGNEQVTIINRPGGVQIFTAVDDNGRLLRRWRRGQDGREVIIIDNRPRRPGASFVIQLAPPVIRIPREQYIVNIRNAQPAAIYAALTAPPVEAIERPYSLDEIRYSPELLARMPRVDVDTVTFDTGAWEINPAQIDRLAVIAISMKRVLDANPDEVFLIEGHTDATGDAMDNLSLSDRRAESVAILLSEQFGIPPENLTTQGYGAERPLIETSGPELANRRVTVRRITPLLTGQSAAR